MLLVDTLRNLILVRMGLWEQHFPTETCTLYTWPGTCVDTAYACMNDHECLDYDLQSERERVIWSRVKAVT